jgi:hypothetical protein
VTVGYRNALEGTSFAIARSSATGQLDPTFGTGGRYLVNLPGGGMASSVVEQPDGKVVVGGITFTDSTTEVGFVLVRLAA